MNLEQSLPKTCKLCQGAVSKKYTIKDIDYYYCKQCRFLQNFYWDDKKEEEPEKKVVNSRGRKEMWPPGERADMLAKGWEMVELLDFPLAWFSRNLHTVLKRIPGYEQYVHEHAKKNLRRLMDYGAGHGVTVFELADQGFDIVGVDPYSPSEDKRILRKHLHELHFPDNSFDGIFAIETMEHIPNVLEIFTELHRILKPGAALLVQTRRLEDEEYIKNRANWFYLKDPTMHVSIYSEPAMRTIAKKVGFKEVKLRGVKLARFVK